MKITPRIKFSLEKAIEAAGNRNQLAIKVGVTQHHIKRWVENIASSIDDHNFEKLFPFIKPFFKLYKGELDFDDPICEDWIEGQDSSSNENFYQVPVISQAAALSWNSAMVPLMDYIDDKVTEEKISFPGAKPGDCAVKIVGDSMAPWYPDGTYVLVRPNDKPRTGKRVIAKLIGGEIVFKIFVETADQYILKSINRHNGKDLIFDKGQQFAFWVWPIKWSFRNEDELDNEMENHGIVHDWQNDKKK